MMTTTLKDMKSFIGQVATGAALGEQEAERAFDIIMSGDATPAQIGGFLMALRVRGETVEEITGAARIMRSKALHLKAPSGAIDIVGTGGDASGTFNISTGAALVVASCGVPIAKHGNRALSSKSGAADVLTSLGVNIDAPMELVERAMQEANIGFMMAPRHHSAMRHVAGPRTELATRTIFNLIGPLSNPAGAKRQLTGVFSREWVEPLAHVLGNLGSERAWVMHGSDGLDELTTTGVSYVAEYFDGKVRTFELIPEDAGIAKAAPADLKGGGPDVNARAIFDLVEGKPGPYRDIVVYNSAAALVIADKAADMKQGAKIAAKAIDEGKTKATLTSLVEITNLTLPEES